MWSLGCDLIKVPNPQRPNNKSYESAVAVPSTHSTE